MHVTYPLGSSGLTDWLVLDLFILIARSLSIQQLLDPKPRSPPKDLPSALLLCHGSSSHSTAPSDVLQHACPDLGVAGSNLGAAEDHVHLPASFPILCPQHQLKLNTGESPLTTDSTDPDMALGERYKRDPEEFEPCP
jgi:hypothetical protein